MNDYISRQDAIYAVGLNTWAGSRISQLPTVKAIPIDKPFLKMKYKGYTVYKTEWLKEHIEMEYRVIKGISETKTEAVPVEWLKKKYEEADDMGMGIEGWSEKDCFGHVIKEWEKENG